MATFAIIAATVSVAAAAAEAVGSTVEAEKQEEYQQARIRNESVQLRLQSTEQSIQRSNQLRGVIAQTTVQEGIRNVGGGSGSVRAIFEHDFSQYDEDDEASRLNMKSKLNNLDIESMSSKSQEHAQIFGAWTGFVKNSANTALSAYEGGGKGMKSSEKGTSSDNAGSNSAYDRSLQDYPYITKNPFNINASE